MRTSTIALTAAIMLAGASVQGARAAQTQPPTLTRSQTQPPTLTRSQTQPLPFPYSPAQKQPKVKTLETEIAKAEKANQRRKNLPGLKNSQNYIKILEQQIAGLRKQRDEFNKKIDAQIKPLEDKKNELSSVDDEGNAKKTSRMELLGQRLAHPMAANRAAQPAPSGQTK